MDSVKKYGILIGKFMLIVFIGSILLSVLNYFLFKTKITHIIGFIYLVITCIVLSFQTARKCHSRGIITGLKIGFLFTFLLFIINIIFYQSSFKFIRLLYYFILIFSCIFGSIIGVNTKKNES